MLPWLCSCRRNNKQRQHRTWCRPLSPPARSPLHITPVAGLSRLTARVFQSSRCTVGLSSSAAAVPACSGLPAVSKTHCARRSNHASMLRVSSQPLLHHAAINHLSQTLKSARPHPTASAATAPLCSFSPPAHLLTGGIPPPSFHPCSTPSARFWFSHSYTTLQNVCQRMPSHTKSLFIDTGPVSTLPPGQQPPPCIPHSRGIADRVQAHPAYPGARGHGLWIMDHGPCKADGGSTVHVHASGGWPQEKDCARRHALHARTGLAQVSGDCLVPLSNACAGPTAAGRSQQLSLHTAPSPYFLFSGLVLTKSPWTPSIRRPRRTRHRRRSWPPTSGVSGASGRARR